VAFVWIGIKHRKFTAGYCNLEMILGLEGGRQKYK